MLPSYNITALAFQIDNTTSRLPPPSCSPLLKNVSMSISSELWRNKWYHEEYCTTYVMKEKVLTNQLLRIHKPIGITPIDFWKKYKFQHGESVLKGAICGKLDPMAEGELLILTGDLTKQMNKFLNCSKIYEFTIALGISTDTDDILGLWTEYIDNINNKQIEEVINEFNNVLLITQQKFHKYSAIRVVNNDGLRRPLWWWSKNNRINEVDIPSKNIKITDIMLIKTEHIRTIDYLKNINNLITMSLLDNNKFRVDKIKAKWNLLNNLLEYIPLLKFKATVSSGTYIRQLVHTISLKTGIPMHVYNINRLSIIL
jgi:tRNA pseudouridine(55) synthase